MAHDYSVFKLSEVPEVDMSILVFGSHGSVPGTGESIPTSVPIQIGVVQMKGVHLHIVPLFKKENRT